MQPATGEAIEIGLPTPSCIDLKAIAGVGVGCQKRLANLLTDFEILLRNRWPEPDQQIARRRVERRDGRFDDSSLHSPPTAVCGRNFAAVAGAKQVTDCRLDD